MPCFIEESSGRYLVMSEFTLTFGIKNAQTAVNISIAERMIIRLFTIKLASLFIGTPPEFTVDKSLCLQYNYNQI